MAPNKTTSTTASSYEYPSLPPSSTASGSSFSTTFSKAAPAALPPRDRNGRLLLLPPAPRVSPPQQREVAGIRPHTAQTVQRRAVRQEYRNEHGRINKKRFFCKACDVTDYGEPTWRDHRLSRRHRLKVNPPKLPMCRDCDRVFETTAHWIATPAARIICALFGTSRFLVVVFLKHSFCLVFNNGFLQHWRSGQLRRHQCGNWG